MSTLYETKFPGDVHVVGKIRADAAAQVPAPVNASDAVSKEYADGLAVGMQTKTGVAVATTAALSDSPTYDNGVSGVGATLTSTAGSGNAFPAVDGTAVALNTRVLVKDQATAAHNGIYELTTAGADDTIHWVLTRTTDADSDADLVGSHVLIVGGTDNSWHSYALVQAGTITVGTTDLDWVGFFGNLLGSVGTGLEVFESTIRIAAAAVSSNHIATAVAGNGLTGGGGSALAVGAGSGVVVSATAVSLGFGSGGVGGDPQVASLDLVGSTDHHHAYTFSLGTTLTLPAATGFPDQQIWVNVDNGANLSSLAIAAQPGDTITGYGITSIAAGAVTALSYFSDGTNDWYRVAGAEPASALATAGTGLADEGGGVIGIDTSGVDETQLANNAVTAVKIANGAVTADKIFDAAVTGVKISAGAVGADALASDAVTTIKIIDDAVTTAKINTGAVDTAELADGAVSAVKIDTGAVGAGALASDAVTTTKIIDDAVTTAKINAGAVDTAELADDAVTAAKLGSGSVVEGAIGAGAISREGLYTEVPHYSAAGSDYPRFSGDATFTLGGATSIEFAAISDNGRYVAFRGTANSVHNVYVAVRSEIDGTWATQATIAHTNTTDAFGSLVRFGGTAAQTLVITSSNGNFYVYERADTSWSLRDTITSAPIPSRIEGAASGSFVVSANAIFYAYTHSSESWSSTTLSAGGDAFTDLAFAGDTEDRIAVANGTSARVYLLSGGTWSLEATPKASDSYKIALDGSGLVLAVGDTTANKEVDVFTRGGASWTLRSTTSRSDNGFPNSLDISRSGRFVYASAYVSETLANNVYLFGCGDAGVLSLLQTYADAGGGTGGNGISGSGHVQVSAKYGTGTVYVHTGAGGTSFDVRPARRPMTLAAGDDAGVTVPDNIGVFELTTGGTGGFALTLPAGSAGQIFHVYNDSGHTATADDGDSTAVATGAGQTFAFTTAWRAV